MSYTMEYLTVQPLGRFVFLQPHLLMTLAELQLLLVWESQLQSEYQECLLTRYLTLFKRTQSCFTNANGPEVFKPCALKWVDPKNPTKNSFGEYEHIDGNSRDGRCQKGNTPSQLNPLCAKYFKKIDELQ